MDIRSNFFPVVDNAFWLRNFDIKETNVKHFKDADVILIGDRHDKPLDHLKFIFLINYFANKQKHVVLCEGTDPSESSLIPRPFYLPDLKIRGWDSEEGFYILNRMAQQTEKALSIVEKCDFKNAPLDKLTKTLKQIVDLVTPHDPLKRLNEIAEYRELLTENEKLNWGIFETFNNFWNSQIANLEGLPEADRRFKSLHLAFFILYYRLWFMFDQAEPFATLIKRQFSLVNSIKVACDQGEKMFLRAGHFHLINHGFATEITAFKVITDILKKNLKDKKYVILFPNDNTQDLNTITSAFRSVLADNLKIRRYLTISATAAICSIALKFSRFNTGWIPAIIGSAAIISFMKIPFNFFFLTKSHHFLTNRAFSQRTSWEHAAPLKMRLTKLVDFENSLPAEKK